MKEMSRVLVIMVLASTVFASVCAQAAETGSDGQVININTATAREIAFLPGIGQTKAEAIIKYRAKRPFKKVEDLMRVKGIGRKSFKKMRPYLSVKGETTLKSKIKIPR